MRVFWDVHGNDGGVSFVRMLTWMAEAIDVWDDAIYEELHRVANERGGKLKSNWNAARERYGIAQ